MNGFFDLLLALLLEAQILKDLFRWNDIGCPEGEEGKKVKELHNSYWSVCAVYKIIFTSGCIW